MESIVGTARAIIPPSIQQAVKEGLKIHRTLTRQIRLMPDFIIIGAQRCGTTALYDLLTRHPFITRAFTKEVHFFDLNFAKGVNWYKSYFPSYLYRYYIRKIHNTNLLTGEASPYYIFHPHTPSRISEIIPHVKVIAILRNPVDRAYSHYYHEVNRFQEKLSFEEAIEREGERISDETQKIIGNEYYCSFNHRHYSYIARGIYIDQIKIWREFFPKEHFLILKSEDFYIDPVAVASKVFEFLNLQDFKLHFIKKTESGRYPKMDPNIRRRLAAYFEPHNQRLYDYLGVDFGWGK